MGENVSGNGRPTKSHLVVEYRKNNPLGTKSECVTQTGLSRSTVYKYWDKYKAEK